VIVSDTFRRQIGRETTARRPLAAAFIVASIVSALLAALLSSPCLAVPLPQAGPLVDLQHPMQRQTGSAPDPPATADPSATADPPATLSYWGPIPPRADSTMAVFEQPPRPLWATSLLVPYRIVASPFTLLRHGAEAVIVYFDESTSLIWLKELLRPREGPFGVTLGLRAGSLSGLGGGMTATHNRFLAEGNQFKLRWRVTTRGSHKVSIGAAFDRFSDNTFEIGSGYHVRPDARFFGIGHATADSTEAHYTQETAWAGASYMRALGGDLSLGVTALFSSVGTRAQSYSRKQEGDEVEISLAQWSPIPFGYRDRSAGLTLGLELTHDNTAEQARPESGTIGRIKISRFWDWGDFAYALVHGLAEDPQVRFWSLRAEFEQFLPLWHRKRALAMRAYTNWIEPDRGTRMPFQRLLTNDDPDLLRGYDDMRWRDRGMAGMTAEYRWPLWNNKFTDGLGTDLFLFGDAGQVFHEYEQIALNRLAVSYGFGIRLLTDQGFRGLVEIGWSAQDVQIRLKTDQIFQYQKGGLLHGRDQIALR